ncbi:hypothetical protein Lal_00040490 [Lupinus albus]|nr:hypothetical protein Lal_00040490 [Lupinus albus]
MFGYQEIVDFATLVDKCRMYEDNLKATEVATPNSNFPRNYGPQRNHVQGRGKERVEDDRKPYATPTRYRDRNFQGSRPPTFPTGGVSTPLCNKCGGLHHGSTCPGLDNKCFYCKEMGHIKRYCPKLSRRMNVVHAERARDHGRAVTPRGTGTSEIVHRVVIFDLVVSTPPSVPVVSIDTGTSMYGWGVLVEYLNEGLRSSYIDLYLYAKGCVSNCYA